MFQKIIFFFDLFWGVLGDFGLIHSPSHPLTPKSAAKLLKKNETTKFGDLVWSLR
jgi:hypothetical protein